MSNIGGKLTWDQSYTEEYGISEAEPTWDFFVDAIKEQYYPVGNYEDQYMRWTTPQQEKGPSSVRVHKYLPYLAHQAEYQILREKIGSKIPRDLHRYIQTEMDFLDISSLGVAYRYVVKTKKKFRHQNKRGLDLQILNNQSMINMSLTNNFLKTHLSHRK
jgi:hypothetical protein